ncbi:MAG TPA: helix-turn-helix domain-containing protein [Polyangiaceae bacterium]|jgi:flagellar biosynthesis protein FlhG|nr:helix-turn-helix domain-containing protein [Polyangiaceae bacterium]
MPDSDYPAVPSDLRGLAPRGARHVVAVAGGRGGVGASVTATNLAVYLAQLGRKVTLVDADPTGAQLHSMLGVELDRTFVESEESEDALELVATPIPGLRLLPQRYSIGSTVPIRPGRKPRWVRALRVLDADYVILDLGAGTAGATLDLFLGADLGIVVVTPEPPSVEGAYRFVRALFQRKLRRAIAKDRYKGRLEERALSELPPMPSPEALVRQIARYEAATGELAAAELASLRPRLVVNGARLRPDADLGQAMIDMSRRHLGVAFDYLGHIEHDDAVWLSVVRSRPLLVDSPTSKSARNIERIARRVLALAQNRVETPEPSPVVLSTAERSLYDVLLTHRSATDEELRRAHKRQRDIYQPGSLPLTSLVSDGELRTEQARIDEAHDTLLDPLRRRAYDVSTFPEAAAAGERPKNQPVDEAVQAERAMLRAELAREINAETEFTGALLRKVRESLGTDLEEIASRTKISLPYLRAIEAEDFAGLPAFVYARGFVHEVARCLSLDPTQVTRTYLKRFREWMRTTQGQGS